MEMFRKLYYKLVTLICIVATFAFLFNMGENSVVYGCLYMFAGLLCFGSWSIGKEEIDPDQPIRNILLLLLWSMLGFGMVTTGIASLVDGVANYTLITVFLALCGVGLVVAYVISIIKNKDIYAIISVVLFIGGLIIGGNSSGSVILPILTLVTLFAAIVCFVISLIKGLADD